MSSAMINASPTPLSRAFWSTRRISNAILCLSLIMLVILHVRFMRANGPTVDEFIHLQAGYRYWQCGDFSSNPEHPPLMKWVAAFPIRNWQVGEFPTECGKTVADADGLTAYFVSQSPHANEMLGKARGILILFPILLLTSVFFAVRSWFGDVAASFAAILITLEPTPVAHSSLVTSDAAVTAFTFATLWFGIEVVRKKSIAYVIGLPVCLGLALASKHSAAVLPVILLVVMMVTYACALPAARRDAVKLAALWVATCAIAVLLLWTFYGFRYPALPYPNSSTMALTSSLHEAGMDGSWLSAVVGKAAEYHLLPESYLAGIVHVATNGSRPAFVWGNLYPTGVWFYFPVALAVKTTAGVLLLAAFSLFTLRDGKASNRIFLPLLTAMILLLSVAMASKLNIGVRHVLPVLVLAIVLASAGSAEMVRQGRVSRVIVCALLALSVVSATRAVPFQLSYANEFVGGSNGLHRVLADSNIDWGQSNIELENVLAEIATHGPCAVAPGNLASVMQVHKTQPASCVLLPTDSGVEIISKELSPVLEPQWSGTLVVQPLVLASTSAYLPFINRRPDEVRGQGSILIYRGVFDFREIAALRRLHRGSYLMQVARESWPSPESRAAASRATEEFAAAVPHCPETNRVELEVGYMASLTAQERWDEARYHADEVLRLTANIPTYRRQRQLVVTALSGGAQ